MEGFVLGSHDKHYHALSNLGFKNEDSIGRLVWNNTRLKDRDFESEYIKAFALKNPFIVDQRKIDESKSKRRLTGKTQVFSNPINPNVRNRSSHSDSVCSIVSMISGFLGHNVELAVAGAKGHDLGHVIYGHLGEDWFTDKLKEREGYENFKFKHAHNGVVIAQRVERKGCGLNLSYEVLKMILNHSGGDKPMVAKPDTEIMQEEVELVFADKIGYTAHDISDAFRYGVLTKSNIPDCMIQLAGITDSREISESSLQNGIEKRCVDEAIFESLECGYFSFYESKTAKLFVETRNWMFENVYYKLDRQTQKTTLNLVYDIIKSVDRYMGVDPLFIMLFMIDWDKQRIMEYVDHNLDLFDQFGFDEVIRRFPDDKKKGFFDFKTINMDPKHFFKPRI